MPVGLLNTFNNLITKCNALETAAKIARHVRLLYKKFAYKTYAKKAKKKKKFLLIL